MSGVDTPRLWWSSSLGQVIEPSSVVDEYRTVSEGEVVRPLPEDAVELLPGATVQAAIAAVLRDSLNELADAIERGATA